MKFEEKYQRIHDSMWKMNEKKKWNLFCNIPSVYSSVHSTHTDIILSHDVIDLQIKHFENVKYELLK